MGTIPPARTLFADNTVSPTAIISADNPRRDGGTGNRRLNNFSVTLDGSDFPSAPGLAYHVGYRHLSAGIGDMADENGFVIGLVKETELANGMVLGLNGEVAYFDNFGGTFDNAVYATAGVSLVSGPWHGELAGTIRSIDFAGAGSMTDQLVQVSGGYTFENGVDLALGYGFSRAEDIKAHVVGVRLSKSLSSTRTDCRTSGTGRKTPATGSRGFSFRRRASVTRQLYRFPARHLPRLAVVFRMRPRELLRSP